MSRYKFGYIYYHMYDCHNNSNLFMYIRPMSEYEINEDKIKTGFSSSDSVFWSYKEKKYIFDDKRNYTLRDQPRVNYQIDLFGGKDREV